jgi:hypothetical protein
MPYTQDVLAGAMEGFLPEDSVQGFRHLHVANCVGEEVSIVIGF